MSYTPNVWQKGDTITAAKLNNMEGGIDDANTPFVVTCTPNSPDYSGIMDKTVAEIDAAYNAGRTVLFRVLMGEDAYAEVNCSVVVRVSEDIYPSYGGYTIDIENNILIYAFTGYTAMGTGETYSTRIYTLTPMGA